MRRLWIISAITICLGAGTQVLHAQSGVLMQELELLDTSLSAAIISSQQAGTCNTDNIEQWSVGYGHVPCVVYGTDYGTVPLADGSIIRWYVDSLSNDPTCPTLNRNAIRVIRTRSDGDTREVVRVTTLRGYNCVGPSECGTRFTSVPKITYDVTNGLLLIGRDASYDTCLTGENLDHDWGVIAVSGFPTLFDTRLSFTPSGQSLSLLTPGFPDGFPSADSLQVWTGNVRTLPDWSQAQPLTCNAAAPPVPGQVLTLADTLATPAAGAGRYYLAASVSGSERRLGRAAPNGVLTARHTEALPICGTQADGPRVQSKRAN